MKPLQMIKKRDGREVAFEEKKVALAVQKAGEASQEFDQSEALRLAGIVRGILEKVIAGTKRECSVEQVQDTVEQVLMAAGHFRTAKAYILYRAERAQQRSVEQSLGVKNDLGISLNQLKVIERRYLLHDADGKAIETPAGMFRRVAKTLAKPEKDAKAKKLWAEKFFEVMSRFEFLPGGRTLNNAGTPQNQLANCFVLPVGDSMGEIFDGVKWTALVHQKGGGTGFDFTGLRPRGDVITKASGGFATGPVSFMKVFDVATRQVMQGGKQRGANMGILSASHPDILEFITCKNEEGEISNFNISIGAQDAFMKAVANDGVWALRNPRTQEVVQEVSARLLMDQIVGLAWRTGDPGMIFWDAINRNNPLLDSVGPITATNPCGEQPLHPFDSCNLGSLNLAAFVRRDSGKASYDWDRLHEVTMTAVRLLDNVIDACTYPLPQIAKTVRQNRRIGLGVMGWADVLYHLGIPYDSEEAVAMAEKTMKAVEAAAWESSEALAKEKGAFPRWKKSWFAQGYDPVSKKNTFKDKPRKYRNVAITTIAPTGTISMAAHCSSGIEPSFALCYVKNVVEEQGLVYVHQDFERALRVALPDDAEYNAAIQEVMQHGSARHASKVPKQIGKVFATAHDIAWEWHVRMQAAFQKYTDNAVSKTVNFPSDATMDQIRQAYLMAWQAGCKGITVYRDKSKSVQVLSAGSGGESAEGKAEAPAPKTAAKGSKKDSAQIMQSKLRHTPLKDREDFALLMAREVKRADSIVLDVEGPERCPECTTEMTEQEGCNLCRNCGYSKCKL